MWAEKRVGAKRDKYDGENDADKPEGKGGFFKTVVVFGGFFELDSFFCGGIFGGAFVKGGFFFGGFC